MRLPFVMLIGCSQFVSAAIAVTSPSNISPGDKFAYGANVGWLNWRPSPEHGVRLSQFTCAGFIYGANIGWISLGDGTPKNGIQYQNDSAEDFGVNHDQLGNLRGLAYGANIGWILFEDRGAPTIDLTTGELSGHIYSPNLGWVSLNDTTFNLAVTHILPGSDADNDGIPDAWENQFAPDLSLLGQDRDADNDGATDRNEYLADTDPTDPADLFRIVEFVFQESQDVFQLSWTTRPTRFYRVLFRPSLGPEAAWSDVAKGLVAPDADALSVTIPAGTLPGHGFFTVESVRPLNAP